MKWRTGNWTSTPDDGRAFLERDDDGLWNVYQTGDDGRLLGGFPKLTEQSFPTVEAAQAWVEENVESHPVERDAISRAVDAGVPIIRLDKMMPEPGEA